jgi:antitoxin (DNA-binding transcriptional repressor) of toxin-antitoxin stability system
MTEHNVVTITITIGELRTRATEIVGRLEETPNLEVVITRYGKSCARLVPLGKCPQKVPVSERANLRNTWDHLPELSDGDFAEAKRI